jgi:hypothetical protein
MSEASMSVLLLFPSSRSSRTRFADGSAFLYVYTYAHFAQISLALICFIRYIIFDAGNRRCLFLIGSANLRLPVTIPCRLTRRLG